MKETFTEKMEFWYYVTACMVCLHEPRNSRVVWFKVTNLGTQVCCEKKKMEIKKYAMCSTKFHTNQMDHVSVLRYSKIFEEIVSM